MTHVVIENLEVTYGPNTIINGLNLEIESGAFIALLGPSGCGKSTLLNALGGLIDTSNGSLCFDGRDVTREDPKDRGIGMVFQSYALYPTMSVRKNMSFGLRIAGASKSEIEEKVGWAAKLLQLEPYLDRKPSELSGGQRQRVAIGRALVKKAGVYLFDEPLSNLDAKLRAELRLEIKKLHKTLGATMVYVTHDQIEAMTLATHVAVMKGGVIQQFDTPTNIYRYPANQYVAGFVGSPEMNFMEGKLQVTEEKVSVLVNESGLQVDLSNYKSVATLTDQMPIVLGIRPEHIKVSSVDSTAKDDVGHNQAQVTVVEPMGAETLLYVASSGGDIAILADGREDFIVGEEVLYAFETEYAAVFCPTSGERL